METILIIDDDPATTRLLEVLLEREGYKIQTENLSVNAVQTTKDFAPHLIILEWVAEKECVHGQSQGRNCHQDQPGNQSRLR